MFGFRQSKWEKLLRRAGRAEERGLPADAHHFYEEALAHAPEVQHATIEEGLARCADHLFNEHSQAAQEYRGAERIDKASERWELALRFARSDAQRDTARAALRDLAADALVTEEQDWHEEEQVDGGQLDEEHTFMMLVGHLPDHIMDAYHELGDAFREAFMTLQEGRPEEALPYFEGAAGDSDSPVLHYEFGQALAALERWDEVPPALERAVELDGDWIEAKLALVRAYWRLENWEGAEAILQEAIDLEIDDVRIYGATARTAWLTEQPDYGLDAIEVVLEKEPANRDALLLKGQLLQQDGQVDDALAVYEAVVQSAWKYDAALGRLNFDREAGVLATRILLAQGKDLDRAEELARAALSVTPPTQRWSFSILLAQVLLAAERTDDAREILEQVALEIPDGESLGRYRVAELLGNEEEAAAIRAELSEEQLGALDSRQSRG